MRLGLRLGVRPFAVSGPASPSASVSGLTNNPTYGPVAETGVQLTAVLNNGTATTWQWKTGTPGSGTPIAGATTATFTPNIGTNVADLDGLYVTIGDGVTTYDSSAYTVRYAAPTATGGIADQVWQINAAITPLDTSTDFTGSNLSFALAPSSAALPAGLSLSGAGVISGTPTALTAGAAIVIRATNSGGTADSAFQITVADVPATMSAPAVTASGSTAISVDRAAAPADNNSAITSYDLRWSTDEASWTTVTGITDPQTVSGLSPSTLYYAQTRANNAMGSGTWSASGSATTDASSDTTAPVVNSSSYSSTTQTVTTNVTEASGSSTCYWALVTNPSAPSVAQIKAGTGGGILEAGSFTVTSGGDTDVISVTNEAGNELHLVFEDASGNNTGTPSAINNTLLTGIVVDSTAPTFSSGNPADDATGVAVGSNLVLTFSENVVANTGNFYLRVVGGALVETFNIATGTGDNGGTISISGTDVTINPGADLTASTAYTIRWDANAIEDAYGNGIAANTGDTLYNFTTAAAGYTQNKVDNNGTGYVTFATSAMSASATMTFSCWVQWNHLTSGNYPVIRMGQGAQGLIIGREDNNLFVELYDSADTEIYSSASTDNPFALSTLYHIYVSVDLGTPSITVRLDQAAPTGMATTISAGNGTLDLAEEGEILRDNFSTINDVIVGDVFLDNAVHALSNFHSSGSPVDISSLGTPEILMDGNATAWNAATNSGSITLSSGGTGFTNA